MIRKRYLLLMLTMLLILFSPVRISAYSGGECFDKFGEIMSYTTGSNTSQMHPVYGHVEYNSAKNNNLWSAKPVTFEVVVQAPNGGSKVNEIKYYIESKDDNTCSGTIPDEYVNGNSGSVTLEIAIYKDVYVNTLNFYGTATNSSGAVVDIDAKTLDIHYDPVQTTTASGASVDKLQPGETLACSDLSDLLNKYWSWVVIICPVLLIALVSIDFAKAVMGIGGKSDGNSSADAMKKATSNTIKRTTALIILLFSPYILNFIFGLAGIDFCF